MESKKKQIICVHLLNNFTGSPKVLKQTITGLIENGFKIDLITSNTAGFLTKIKGVNYYYNGYWWSNNKIIALLNYILAQIRIFILVLIIKTNKHTILYSNTLIPFGAVFAAKLKKIQVLYHIHEFYVKGGILSGIYSFFYNHCANKTIFVSNFLAEKFRKSRSYKVIYNSLDPEFVEIANDYFRCNNQNGKTVLLVSSLKYYKGIFQFVELSRLMKNINFEMVLSCSINELNQFSLTTNIPENLKIYPLQTDLHPFYQKAKILLNLSIPDCWIETFGITILEGMSYGLPTIIPPVGGPLELVDDGVNGYHVDSRDIHMLQTKIEILYNNQKIYKQLSNSALLKSRQFNYNKMIDEVVHFISSDI